MVASVPQPNGCRCDAFRRDSRREPVKTCYHAYIAGAVMTERQMSPSDPILHIQPVQQAYKPDTWQQDTIRAGQIGSGYLLYQVICFTGKTEAITKKY